MVTVRGLFNLTVGREPPIWALAIISALLVGAAAFFWDDLDTGYSIAIIVSVLTAYHAYSTELSVLLIPFAVLAARICWNGFLLSLTGLVFLASYGLAFVGLYGPAALLCATLLVVGLLMTRERGAAIAILSRA